MSKIKELLNDNESVLVFDVDGVLAIMDFGEYNHYILSDEEWDRANIEGKNFYTNDRVSKKMQNFLLKKDMNRIYVITRSITSNEFEFKKEYLNKYYNIIKENIFFVKNDFDKKDKLKLIKEKYQNLEDYKIVMIDDTVSILSDIMENTNFSTSHISSFLDI